MTGFVHVFEFHARQFALEFFPHDPFFKGHTPLTLMAKGACWKAAGRSPLSVDSIPARLCHCASQSVPLSLCPLSVSTVY